MAREKVPKQNSIKKKGSRRAPSDRRDLKKSSSKSKEKKLRPPKSKVVRRPQPKKRAVPRRQQVKTTSSRSSLEKSQQNPILKPHGEHPWESYQTFNPAALYSGDKIHLLYRALGEDGISRLGYAASRDGLGITERLSEPVYTAPKAEDSVGFDELAFRIAYESGGGWGGCEDPRMVQIDDKIFVIFVAFDGWASVRIGLTSIKLNDFLRKRWKWTHPVLISPPGQIHKNWVLFPERIGGKYAILHSISPKILIDYFDTLDHFDEKKFIKSGYARVERKGAWDNFVRGAGPPPIRTKHGWLLLYHATEKKEDHKYKIGAMLLDLKNPTKVLYRSQKPILMPDEVYENEGHKAGIIYSCGAVVIDDQLFVYYGGADTVACVATADLGEFLKTLMSKKQSELRAVRKPRLS
ncbi:MAG: hypothetical protein Q8Q94_02345 [bacterium]|nr:hypothetical protein [bacterium]